LRWGASSANWKRWEVIINQLVKVRFIISQLGKVRVIISRPARWGVIIIQLEEVKCHQQPTGSGEEQSSARQKSWSVSITQRNELKSQDHQNILK
jgi:hypothetical protein